MPELTVEEKAKLFDYIASRMDSAKFCLNFGGCEKVYHEQRSSEKLAAELYDLQSFENHKE